MSSEIHDYPVIGEDEIVNGRYYQKLSENPRDEAFGTS